MDDHGSLPPDLLSQSGPSGRRAGEEGGAEEDRQPQTGVVVRLLARRGEQEEHGHGRVEQAEQNLLPAGGDGDGLQGGGAGGGLRLHSPAAPQPPGGHSKPGN